MRLLILFVCLTLCVSAETAKELDQRISALRNVPDSERGSATRKLASEVRALPPNASRTSAAQHLAMLSTEGDFGRRTLQEVADTFAEALRAAPAPKDVAYQVLAELERLEHVTVKLDDPKYAQARSGLQQAAERRAKIDFALKDLNGRTWKLSDLRGKVVLVNLWATWCPPCRKEMPDLDALAKEFGPKGLVVLGLTDEDAATARKYLSDHPYSYPILLDEGGKVGKAYDVPGIPKSFVYDRQGTIAAESIDMRTQRQFRELLSRAGLK